MRCSDEFFSLLIDLYVDKASFFLKLLGEHIFLSVISIVIITVIGILLGIIIRNNKKLATFIIGICNLCYTIPSIALFGILLAITGIGIKSALIAIVLYGLLPVVRNTYIGIKEVDPMIIEAAIGMGTTNRQLLLKIQLPLASPVIIAGLRTMIVMTIAMVGIASFIGAGGLGVAIWRGITTNNALMTVAGSILIAIVAIIADLIMGWIEKKIRQKVLGN
ncbi:ABC transporter permease [endosymbiont 'TC1' of Trimyema compressum]|uniref:ABC transporter permease n=1 Tax=endosymbiont 'TC1' of Trimyema compressum TaxID=243899 RepID=UPI000A790118|nr:ABC transporter permease [endosymbiont 'TC1' of Trimyema compressum]